MRVSGQRIIVFGDSLSKHGHDSSPEIWDVNQGSNRPSSSPGDLLASMLAEQGAQAVRVNARVSRSAWNFFQRENSAQLLAADAHFKPTRVVIMLGTNDVGLGQIPDREAFTKLRDSYLAMGAEVWAVGPFANTSLDQAGVVRVVQTMRGVFGRQFIDGREISLIVKPGRDGVHYDQIGARQLAIAIAGALAGRMATNTIWATAGFSLLGVGLAVIAAMAYRRYGGKQLGLAALSRKDEKELQELIKQPGAEVLDVAQDKLLENGERVSTFARTGGELGPHSKSYFQLDLGRDKINWWIERKGMNRCSAHFRVFNDGIQIGDGTEINAGGGREPKAFIENYGTESAEYCERSAASTAWQIAKTLKRMPGMPHGRTDNLILIKNAQNDVREAINRDKDQDHSEPEELYGALDAAVIPEPEARQKFADMIREPDPDFMDVAEDFALEQEIPLADKGRKRLGTFVLNPHGAPDAPKTVVGWSATKTGLNTSTIAITVDFNRAASSDLHERLDELHQRLDSEGRNASEIQTAIDAEIDRWTRDSGVKLTGERVDVSFNEAMDPSTAARLASAIAWDVAKRVKRLPEGTDKKTLHRTLSASLANRDKLLNAKPQLYGASGEDVDVYDLFSDESPNAMQVAEDLLLERGWKLTRGFMGGGRHYSIDMSTPSIGQRNLKRTDPKAAWTAEEVAEDRKLWKKAGASVETQPGDAGHGTYPGDQKITRTVRLFAYNGAQESVEREVKLYGVTIDEARKFAAAATWAMAKQIKPREIDTDVSDVVFETARMLRAASRRKKLLQPSELFGLGRKITRADVVNAATNLEGTTNIVDGKRSNESEAAIIRSGARQVACKSGLDLKKLATCWTRNGALGKPQSMLKTIAAESQSADEFARRAEAWASSESNPPSDKAIAKLFKGASVAMIEQAREARQASTQARYKKLARGLRGDDRDQIIADAIKDSAERAGTWKGSRKVFVSDAFEQLRKDGRDDGFTLEEFKHELVRLHKAGKIKLARADLVAAMPANKVAQSEIDARGATFNFVQLDGLLGATVGETFKRNNSKTAYTVVEIVRPARSVGTLKIGETIRISHGDELIDVTDAGGTWLDDQGRKYKRTK